MERDNDTADDGLASNDAANDLSRRNLLKTTGALGALAVGGALSTGSAAAAPNSEPETIEAPYKVVLGDGDVLANKRIVANGSSVSIVARGNDWEIRNVGIEGKAQSNPITVETAGGSGLIENVYVGGVSSADETPIFVHRTHSGTITIRNVNVGNTSDSHGIYASAPGSPSYRKQGGGGAVHIESCYAHDTGGNGFRIGSDGSYVKNSVAANCDNSGVWNQWQRGRVENVAIEADVNAFNVGANSYDNRGSECKLSVSNVEYDAPNEVRKAPGIGDWNYYSASGVNSTSSPDLSPPSGVPMSAAEAAGGSSGGSSSSSSSSSGSDSTDDETDTTESDAGSGSEESSESSDDAEESTNEDTSVPDSAVTVEVNADSNNDSSIDYELTANGTFYRSSDDDSEDSANGSSASGTVWPSFTDTFYLDGDLTGFDHEGDATVTVDGSAVDSDSGSSSDTDEETESDETESESESSDSSSEDDADDSSSSDSSSAADEDRSLEVEGAGSTTNGPREYTLTVTGTITDLEGNPDDSVSGDTVNGKVWAPFFDRYAFSGEVDSFETDGDVEVRVDGETVDPDSL